MTDWHFQYPSSALTRSHVGDRDYAVTFRGEADKLLYQLKNLMTFQQLGQLKMVRVFTDGTVITAKSHFGYDSVEVDVSKSTTVAVAEETCTITFVYLNEYVQPMRYPGGIQENEQEGIDYVKTYYSFDKSKCPSCANEVEWEFTFNYETDEQIDYYDSEPENHCVISQDDGCYGQIIEYGEDADGQYIIWKAYTESSNYNRSGLGYMQLHVFLKNKGTDEIICEVTEIIGVDCCIKDGLGSPDIYWESWAGADCTTFYMYGSTTLCKVPATISASDLVRYSAGGGGHFYAIPELGGCPNYQWALSGFGTLTPQDDLGEVVLYTLLTSEIEIVCSSNTTISVTDRCGMTDSFIAQSCCDTADPLSIDYILLLMSCGESQTLTADGGCAPYTWKVTSGGGSVSYDSDGFTAIYSAPNTNPSCVNNPTIQVTDCCGSTASISLAVNCYTDPDTAYKEYGCTVGADGYSYCQSVPGCPFAYTRAWTYQYYGYMCDTTLIGGPYWINNMSACGSSAFTTETCCYFANLAKTGTYCDCSGGGGGSWCTGSLCNCIEWPLTYGCGDYQDVRTDLMKEQGCCPLNPETGLPY